MELISGVNMKKKSITQILIATLICLAGCAYEKELTKQNADGNKIIVGKSCFYKKGKPFVPVGFLLYKGNIENFNKYDVSGVSLNYPWQMAEVEEKYTELMRKTSRHYREKEYFIERLKERLKFASNNGMLMELIVGSLGGGAPAWLKEKYGKDVVRYYSKGSWHGFYWDLNINNPQVRKEFKKHIQNVVKLGENYGVQIYDLWNEPGYYNLDKASMQKFREWCKNKYGKIGRLNDVWGTMFESFQSIPDLKIISHKWRPKVSPYYEMMWFDYLKFNRERMTKFYLWMAKAVKEVDPKAKVLIKKTRHCLIHGGNLLGTDYEQLPLEVEDIFGFDSMFMGTHCGSLQVNPFSGIVLWDYYRSLANGKPLMENEYHIFNKPYYKKTPGYGKRKLSKPCSPDLLRTAIWSPILHGIDALMIYNWDYRSHIGSAFMSEQFPPKTRQMLKKTIEEVNRLSEYIKPDIKRRFSTTKAAILYSDTTRLAVATPGKHYKKVEISLDMENITQDFKSEHLNHLLDIYQALKFNGFDVEFVTEKQIAKGKLNKYSFLAVPNASYLPEKIAKKILNWKKVHGKLLLLSGNFAEYNENLKTMSLPIPIEKGIVKIPMQGIKKNQKAIKEITDAYSLKPGVEISSKNGIPLQGIDVNMFRKGNEILFSAISYRKESLEVIFKFNAFSKEKIVKINSPIDSTQKVNYKKEEKKLKIAIKPLSPIFIIFKMAAKTSKRKEI